MPFDPRIAQQVQTLISTGVPVNQAFRLAGVNTSERVYYGLNRTGQVISTAIPPPAQIQANALSAEIAADKAIIAAQRAVLDDPNASRQAKANATRIIASKEQGLTEYNTELAIAQNQVKQQTVVPTPARPVVAQPPTQPPPPPSLIPPGATGVATDADGNVIGYFIGSEFVYVDGVAEEYEAEDVDTEQDPELAADEPTPAFVDIEEPSPVDTEQDPFDTPDDVLDPVELADPVVEELDPDLIGPLFDEDVDTNEAEDVDPDLDPELELDVITDDDIESDEAIPLTEDQDPYDTPDTEIDPSALVQQPDPLADPTGDIRPPLPNPPPLAAPPPVDDQQEQEEQEGTPAGDQFTAADIEEAEMGAEMRAAISRAQQQSTFQDFYGQKSTGDWRVRIRLAPDADYLYKDKSSLDLLRPLVATDGVIFPYVPTVQMSYSAAYDATPLTHSNYQGYFYKNSKPGDISITGAFTAQDTFEAAYLLAVIHFFRSATKMFYGQDAKRGSPPPIVLLSGFGQYQFNNHPCVISNFQYSLPNSVDYIRVTTTPQQQNMVINNNQVSSSPVSTIDSVYKRVKSLINYKTGDSVAPGAQTGWNDLAYIDKVVAGTDLTTYVPTRMEITVTLLPIQTRSQVSQQFSVKQFANGSLLKGGFW